MFKLSETQCVIIINFDLHLILRGGVTEHNGVESIFSFQNVHCLNYMPGASPGFGRGGGQEIFFPDLGICMSRSDMLRMAKPCALLGGFGGMLPRENFLKTVQFGAF